MSLCALIVCLFS